MTTLQISIATFFLALATIGLLYVIMMIADKPHIVWRLGLCACMCFLGIGVILIFVPYYSRYAPFVGMIGVFLMIVAVFYDRYTKAHGKQYEGISRGGYVVRAAVFVIMGGLVAAPFFTLFSNQQDVKRSQYSIYNLLIQVKNGVSTLTGSITVLIDMLERDHIERQAFRAEFSQQMNGVKTDVKRGLLNDSEVKQNLRRANRTKSSPALIIIAPKAQGIPPGNFTLPNVQTPMPAPTPRRGRRTSYEGGPFDVDQDVATHDK